MVVRLADWPNVGLVIDAWQHIRGSDGPAALCDLPVERVVAVELGDARPIRVSLLQESISARLWPGEGVLDVVGLLRVLDEIGVNVPVGVEVVSKRIHAFPVSGPRAGLRTRPARYSRGRGPLGALDEVRAPRLVRPDDLTPVPGTAAFGDTADAADASKIVGAALDAAVATVDSATPMPEPVGGDPRRDPSLVPRDRIVVCSKVGLRPGDSDAEHAAVASVRADHAAR